MYKVDSFTRYISGLRTKFWIGEWSLQNVQGHMVNSTNRVTPDHARTLILTLYLTLTLSLKGMGKMRVAKLRVGILRVEVRVKRASIGVKCETVNVRGAY